MESRLRRLFLRIPCSYGLCDVWVADDDGDAVVVNSFAEVGEWL